MKKAMSIMLALMLIITISIATAEIDIQSMSDEELNNLIEEAQKELAHRAESNNEAYEWSENDFVFYDENMKIGLQPSSDPDFLSSWITMEDLKNGQTYRGLKLGDYPEKVMSLYDFSDADWELRDTDSKYGNSERQKDLTAKWKEQGYTAQNLLEQTPFLTSKGYGFLMTLSIYREDGEFRTASQLTYSGFDPDQLGEDASDFAIMIAKRKYSDQHLRARFLVSIFSGRVHAIQLTDCYLEQLKYVYKDDGSINEEYAYVLELK